MSLVLSKIVLKNLNENDRGGGWIKKSIILREGRRKNRLGGGDGSKRQKERGGGEEIGKKVNRFKEEHTRKPVDSLLLALACQFPMIKSICARGYYSR